MNNFDVPPVEDEKEELEIETDKVVAESVATNEENEAGSKEQKEKQIISEGDKTMESFRKYEYERLKRDLEKTLQEFDLKILNEAEKYVNEVLDVAVDFKKRREDRGENEDDKYRDNSIQNCEEIIEAILSIKSLKGQSIKGLDIEESLDRLAQFQYLNLNKLTDEKFSSLLREFKGKSYSKGVSGIEFFHDVGDLVCQLRDAVKNLAEFKYPKLIQEQVDKENELKIRKAKESMDKININ